MEKEQAKLIGSLDEVKMDRDGEYTIKIKLPHSEKDNIKILEDFVEKPIKIVVEVEEKYKFNIPE